MERKPGRSKLVFNKKTKTIDIIRFDPMQGIRAVYEKHKGLDAVLLKEPTGYDSRGEALFDFWQAIKKAVEGE